MTLLALYVGCLALGGVLIGASLIGGIDKSVDGGADHGADHGVDHGADHDGDLDHEADLDHDHDHAHDHPAEVAHDAGGVGTAILATLLSVRFWTFALAAFGLTGVLLTLFGSPAAIVLAVSLVDGLVAGSVVTSVLRKVSRDTVSSALDTRRLSGIDAEVVLAVGPGKTGKIRLTHQGQILEMMATTREDHLLARGARVLIVEVKDGTADVTSTTPQPPHRPTSTPTTA